MSHLRFIDQQRVHYPVQLLCQALGVMLSRYYAWRKGAATGVITHVEPAWETALIDVFDHHQRRYGTRRLRVELLGTASASTNA